MNVFKVGINVEICETLGPLDGKTGIIAGKRLNYSLDDYILMLDDEVVDDTALCVGGSYLRQKNSVEKITLPLREKFTLFYRGPFSQWYPSVFIGEGYGAFDHDITFNSAEQYMMFFKAMIFNDTHIAGRILEGTNPAVHKKLGKMVKGFKGSVWDQVKRDVVFNGNLLKFTQNEKLASALEATIGTHLVEASPTDTIWGIGLDEFDPRCNDRKHWKGQNLLGQILDDVRTYMHHCEIKMMPCQLKPIRYTNA